VADDSGKTEEASEKRIRDARRKGQVAVSKDLMGGAVFIVIFTTVSLTAGTWLTGLVGYYQSAFKLATRGGSVQPHLARALNTLNDMLVGPLFAGMVAAVAIGFMQTGGLFSVEALKIDPQRLMPNFKKLVSLNTAMEVLKGFVKVALAAAVAWAAIKPLAGGLAHLTGMKPLSIMVLLGYGALKVGNRMILVVAVIGVADFMWQRHSHMKGLRMSRDEQKREHKESEGDPQLKHERKRFHKELLDQRMVNDVKKANFVVVNPTHIAVAIRYDRETDAAPIVLAKGELLLAERIKQAAREAGIPIFRDVGLARALRDVEEGDEVPEALYEAIAEILRVVYGHDAPSEAPPAAEVAEAAAEPVITTDVPRGSWQRG
jgi:flagellar biosynthetic protein FlhB